MEGLVIPGHRQNETGPEAALMPAAPKLPQLNSGHT